MAKRRRKAKPTSKSEEDFTALDRLLWPLKVAEKNPQPEYPAVIGVGLWMHQATRTPYKP